MSARIVWSGTRPSRYHSRRAISPPPPPPRGAGARDPDAVGAEPERGGDRLLHRAAERHPLLELQGHVLGDELRVELRVDDLLDVQVDLLARAHLQLVLQLLDLRPLAADDDARTH